MGYRKLSARPRHHAQAEGAPRDGAWAGRLSQRAATSRRQGCSDAQPSPKSIRRSGTAASPVASARATTAIGLKLKASYAATKASSPTASLKTFCNFNSGEPLLHQVEVPQLVTSSTAISGCGASGPVPAMRVASALS
jgi:hypothetical protein